MFEALPTTLTTFELVLLGVLTAATVTNIIQSVIITRQRRANGTLKNVIKTVAATGMKAIMAITVQASRAIAEARSEAEQIKQAALDAFVRADNQAEEASGTITELQMALHNLQSQREPVDEILSGLRRHPGGPESLDEFLFGGPKGGPRSGTLAFSVGDDGELTPLDAHSQSILDRVTTNAEPNATPFTLEGLLSALATLPTLPGSGGGGNPEADKRVQEQRRRE
jgi:hypothetical protein